MTPESIKAAIDLVASIKDLGIGGILLLVIFGGYKGWWVYGSTHRSRTGELEKDRDWWRQMMLDSMEINRGGVEVVRKVVSATADKRGG